MGRLAPRLIDGERRGREQQQQRATSRDDEMGARWQTRMVMDTLTDCRLGPREGWQQRPSVKEQEEERAERDQKLGQDPVVTEEAPGRTDCLDDARQQGRDAERQYRESPDQVCPDIGCADDTGVHAREPSDRQN